ncbi:sporulation protein YhbH [Virgibacillus siamensis]|uniref:sporulation protein YhbH n=1 Tax=Virgibacillus siamensis TaxID=480071 RepID=UPI000987CAF4|nr:sporulation protein YhbH [Virgibacillus siamensis]
MREEKENFVVSEEDWSLHRKGFQDQKRHMDKVKEAIRDNLPDLVSEENIIMSNGRDIIKIPIRSLDEYKIRYNYNKSKHVGQGDGDSEVGDVIARDPNGNEQGNSGSGKGKQAGDQPGQAYYETEVSMAELEEVLFREMELPDLREKEQNEIKTEEVEFNDVRKKGLMGNIDKKRTILTALKRNATEGDPGITPIRNDDLRFKTWNDVVKPESKAVVLAMMDTSASMGSFEKYLARSFFFWMTKFLRTKYEMVDIAYIAHHTEAKVVPEEAFFSKGESGGTMCSSAYRRALELIDENYHPVRYNIYPFHFSDGENITSDNPQCMTLVNQLMDVSNMFGYAEVNSYNRQSTLMRAYRDFENPKFHHYILKEKQDVYHALKHFFQKKEAAGV